MPGHPAEEIQYPMTSELPADTTRPEASAPWTWNTRFARSSPITPTSPIDATQQWFRNPLWLIEAVSDDYRTNADQPTI